MQLATCIRWIWHNLDGEWAFWPVILKRMRVMHTDRLSGLTTTTTKDAINYSINLLKMYKYCTCGLYSFQAFHNLAKAYLTKCCVLVLYLGRMIAACIQQLVLIYSLHCFKLRHLISGVLLRWLMVDHILDLTVATVRSKYGTSIRDFNFIEHCMFSV